MTIEVATGELLHAINSLNLRDGETVHVDFPPGRAELSIHRGWWETVMWSVESQLGGPTACVRGEELRDAADRPMISAVDGAEGGGLLVGETLVPEVEAIPPPPRLNSLLGGAELSLPLPTSNPYAISVADIEQGGARLWLPQPLVQRLRRRAVVRARLFQDDGTWYVSGVQVEETALIRVVGRVGLY
jgi:hypothetical protein